ncbi:hypothetical protein AB0C52_12855 [Streptomyces sp. NPDC048717]|uniref:hypothetical protein n=1 Tax=Streptomyces sp. NPDC048717 TaxID=3154928 RepID=UPI0034142AEC
MTDPFLAALAQATRTVVARAQGQLPAAPAASISHIYCCAPDRALCGLDLTGASIAGDGGGLDQDCVVCIDLEAGPCPDCAEGRRPR